MLHNQNVKVPQCKSVKMLLCHIVNTFLLKWNPAAGEHGRRLMTQRSWVRSQSLNITFSWKTDLLTCFGEIAFRRLKITYFIWLWEQTNLNYHQLRTSNIIVIIKNKYHEESVINRYLKNYSYNVNPQNCNSRSNRTWISSMKPKITTCQIRYSILYSRVMNTTCYKLSKLP